MTAEHMMEHYFASELLVSNYDKKGTPRLRVSLRTRDYKFMSPNGDLVHLVEMILKRQNGDLVKLEYPRISKGTSQGNYTPHYINVPTTEVEKYGFKPNEPVAVTVKWLV